MTRSDDQTEVKEEEELTLQREWKSIPGRGNSQCKGPEADAVWNVQRTAQHS